MSHTSGPWTNKDGMIWAANGRFVAEVAGFSSVTRKIQDVANALIAAAPDLLYALEDLWTAEKLGDDHPVLIAARDNAQAAIDKATK